VHDFLIAEPGYKASLRRMGVISDSEITLKVTLDQNR
jgi:hypothetical protein